MSILLKRVLSIVENLHSSASNAYQKNPTTKLAQNVNALSFQFPPHVYCMMSLQFPPHVYCIATIRLDVIGDLGARELDEKAL